MSATGRGGERRDSDSYPTPAWAVHRLLERCPLPGGRWLEPAAGEGAIIRAVREVRSDVAFDVIELRPECAAFLGALGARVGIADFLRLRLAVGASLPYEVAILNPPFVMAEAFVQRCRRLARSTVALLRLNFLEGEDRAPWLRLAAPDVYVLPNRPSFTGEGTDATAYAWMVFAEDGKAGGGRIEILASTPLSVRRSGALVAREAARGKKNDGA